MRQIIFDTETTGMNTNREPEKYVKGEDVSYGHRIIEIGCVELIDRHFTGNNYHQYINPERLVDAKAFEVHGISNDFLNLKPTFAQIFPELWDYLQGADELIAHNMSFDKTFFNREFSLLQKNIKLENHFKLIDTLKMAQEKAYRPANLDALCRRFNIDNSSRNLHGALLDAKLLAEVYLKMSGGQKSLNLAVLSSQKNINSDFKSIDNWLEVIVNDDEKALHQQILEKLKDKK